MGGTFHLWRGLAQQSPPLPLCFLSLSLPLLPSRDDPDKDEMDLVLGVKPPDSDDVSSSLSSLAVSLLELELMEQLDFQGLISGPVVGSLSLVFVCVLRIAWGQKGQ